MKITVAGEYKAVIKVSPSVEHKSLDYNKDASCLEELLYWSLPPDTYDLLIAKMRLKKSEEVTQASVAELLKKHQFAITLDFNNGARVVISPEDYEGVTKQLNNGNQEVDDYGLGEPLDPDDYNEFEEE